MLDDGHLSPHEIETLVTQARRSGLTADQLRQLHWSAWSAAFGTDAEGDWSTLTPVRRREMLTAADGLGLDAIVAELTRIIEAMADAPASEHATWLKKLRIAIADGSDAENLRATAREYGARLAVNVTKTVTWLATETPTAVDKMHNAARSLGVEMVPYEVAQRRLDAAIAEAELNALAKKQAQDDLEFARRQQEALRAARSRPAWYPVEFDHDPPRGRR